MIIHAVWCLIWQIWSCTKRLCKLSSTRAWLHWQSLGFQWCLQRLFKTQTSQTQFKTQLSQHQASLRVKITSVEDNFWEHSPSCGDVQTIGQLEGAERPLVVPGSQLCPHSTQPYVPSPLAVLAQGTPSGRGCHIPLGKEWTQLSTESQQDGLSQSRGFLCHTFRCAIQSRRVKRAD